MNIIEFMEDMKSFGLDPDALVYDLALTACMRAPDRDVAFMVRNAIENRKIKRIVLVDGIDLG